MGGSITEGRIIYACLVKFAESFRHQYTYCLDSVRRAAFTWVGGDSNNLPAEYDPMLKSSYASHINGLASYYVLSEAL